MSERGFVVDDDDDWDDYDESEESDESDFEDEFEFDEEELEEYDEESEYIWRNELLLNSCEEANFDAVLALIERGVNINQQDEEGKSALHYAIQSGFDDGVKLLLQNKADITILDDCNQTPLHYACSGETDSVELVQELITEYILNSERQNKKENMGEENSNIDNKENNNDIEKEIITDEEEEEEDLIKPEISQNYVNMINVYGRTCLHEASLRGYYETVEYLVESGGNINCSYLYTYH
eukprot:TRINITY_DN806_c0_g1_i1.p1 TRINITY_DN806_c0_g1~~TRINITY_DN806_c0_g1_i1.p1  ORF type:complete len:239 (+),score=117.21 TRINITY_DN806_c0_g1_i1:35-751(+)